MRLTKRCAAHPFVAHAPTMRVPMNIQGTDHVYLAMWAALTSAHRHNRSESRKIDCLACPGLGTGTGGGIVVHRRVLSGRNAIAGEWGHNPLPSPREGEWPGPPCYCGKSGCIETFLSGPGLARDYLTSGGPSLSAKDIAARADAGEPLALDSLARYEDRMARALASVINIIDPDVIVLGGGLSNIDRLYGSVPSRWRPFVFSDRIGTALVRAAHGDSSGVRGAAWLWEES